jgi:hypothetical protein
MSSTLSFEDSSSWLSFTFLSFLDGIFSKGYKQALELQDLGPIGLQDRADLLYQKFTKEYGLESKKPMAKRSLWGVLWRTTGFHKLVGALLLFCISAALNFGPVEILTNLVKYFQGAVHYETWQLWLQCALLFVFPVVGSICLAHSNMIMV